MTTYESYDSVNSELDRLGTVTNTDDELERAMMKICGDAENSTEAKMALEAMGYLPYMRQSIYTEGGRHRRYSRSVLSRTNGLLERRKYV